MNYSDEQAAAFEPKWTCEEPETRQTLTATVHPKNSVKQSDKCGFYTLCVRVCLQINHLLNKRMIEESQSTLVSSLLS